MSRKPKNLEELERQRMAQLPSPYALPPHPALAHVEAAAANLANASLMLPDSELEGLHDMVGRLSRLRKRLTTSGDAR